VDGVQLEATDAVPDSLKARADSVLRRRVAR
jgi:hypothetical protein